MSNYFDPVFPLAWTIPIFLLCLFIFTWLEARRKHRFTALRAIAQALALLSLLALALRPFYESSVPRPQYLLLTEHFAPASADSILRENQALEVLRAPGAEPYKDAREIKSYYELTDMQIAVVIGDGLPQGAVDMISDPQFLYIGNDEPEGLTELNVRPYIANRASAISGQYFGATGDALRLQSPGKVEDSLVIKTNGLSAFALSFIPKTPGLFRYSIESRRAGRRNRQDVPVEVIPQRKLRLLMLQVYPVAETRFLKNFLASKGHELVVRSQLSKDNFRYEFDNTPDGKLNQISDATLAQFDLLITDGETFDGLERLEKTAIEKSVHSGMGLLLMLRTQPPSEKYIASLLALTADKTAPDTVRFQIPGHGYFTQPFLPLASRNSDALSSNITSGGRMLSAFGGHGAGKIGFQLLQETYKIALAGNPDAYAEMWSSLLETVARRAGRKFAIRISPQLPLYQNDPMKVQVHSTGEQPVLFVDSIRVPLAEDALTDDLWSGTVWAGTPGWHRVSIESEESANYFVFEEGTAGSLRIAEQHRLNRMVSANVSAGTLRSRAVVRQPVPPAVFFIIFLVSAGFLWLAPKI